MCNFFTENNAGLSATIGLVKGWSWARGSIAGLPRDALLMPAL